MSLGSKPWTKLEPVVGTHYVASAGAARDPDPLIADRDSLLDHMLELPPSLAPGALPRLLGKRSPPLEAAALVIDTVDEPAPVGLLAWLADLGARDIDLSWIGNESGPGLVHTIQQPLREGLDVRAALLSHAREHVDLVTLVREHAEVWLEDGGGVPVKEGRLVHSDPAYGWIEDLELEAIIEGIEGHAGAWLDPGTPHARPAWSLLLPAPPSSPRCAAPSTSPRSSPSAPHQPTLHLVGGIDRGSGELVGFVFQRVWT